MPRALRIGLRLSGLDTFDIKSRTNVQGDELVGRGWAKYLQRHPEVERTDLYPAKGPIAEDLDVLIHFHPALEHHPRIPNLCYWQNAFRRKNFPGGPVAVYREYRDQFQAHLFTSLRLQRACGPGAVIPFATDPEFFFPQRDPRFTLPVSFVGNNVRGKRINRRYLHPALRHGLVIYGNRWRRRPLRRVWQGKLPMPDLPRLYSSCAVNLNAHLAEHAEFDTVNLRVYDILACQGFLISDPIDSIPEMFGEAVVITHGGCQLRRQLRRFLADPAERERRAQAGREIVLASHTYTQRTNTLIHFLRDAL